MILDLAQNIEEAECGKEERSDRVSVLVVEPLVEVLVLHRAVALHVLDDLRAEK